MNHKFGTFEVSDKPVAFDGRDSVRSDLQGIARSAALVAHNQHDRMKQGQDGPFEEVSRP